MTRKALIIVLLAVAAIAVYAQETEVIGDWRVITNEDMLTGNASYILAIEAEAEQGTLNTPTLYIRTEDGSQYNIFVHWGGYTIWDERPLLRVRFGEDEPDALRVHQSNSKEATFLTPYQIESTLEQLAELSDGGKVVMQVEKHAGQMTARWDVSRFNEAFAELNARAATE